MSRACIADPRFIADLPTGSYRPFPGVTDDQRELLRLLRFLYTRSARWWLH